MRKPNFFKQYDSRWAGKVWHGQTLRAHGCAPTAIANVLSVMEGHEDITPAVTWKWICDHGYMTVGHGTAWEGVTKCLEHYGVKSRVSTSKSEVKNALKENNFTIPLMGHGLWTRGGHFITAYFVDDNDYIYISDPASNAAARQKNKFDTFWSQCKRTWLIVDTSQYFHDKEHPTGDEVYSLYVYSDDGYANIRSGRGTNQPVVATFKNGKKVKLRKYKNGWYQIATGKYKGRYISETVLSKYKSISQKYVVSVKSVRVRAGYSTKTKTVKVLAKWTKVKATKQRGRWVYVPSVKGWIMTKDKDGKVYMERTK